MQIKTGIDLGKMACDGRGKVVSRRRLSRTKLVAWLANLPPCLIGMEASCGAHHLARRLREPGHEVRLMPAPDVRPFVKTNKHDHADAAGVAEAVQRPEMRFLGFQTGLGALPVTRGCRSRARRSSTCRRCIGCATGWSRSARG